MRYLSTRDTDIRASFCDILLEGLAAGGGLYLPESYPQLTREDLSGLRRLLAEGGYAAVGHRVLSLFIDDIPSDDLLAICRRAWNGQVFSSDEVVPVTELGDGLWLAHLSEGPTAAFKDLAMQLLGQLFEYELDRRNQTLTILGATSGDTGSAAEYAMSGRHGIETFMLTPAGRMTPFQQAQMFSLDDPSVHNLAVEGVFDDCQDLVKAVMGDATFKREHRIGAVNSINWARLVAQVVYYVVAWLRTTTSDDQQVSFTVPTGNFGNICAGHVARQMGLPIARLVVATNENDVLDEFFRTGVYRPRTPAETPATSSPSMDISKASNVERFVFDLVARDAARVRQLFAADLPEQGFFDLSEEIGRVHEQFGFSSGSSTHADRVATIRRVHEQWGVTVDPHTADGVKVALDQRGSEPMVVLETAVPVKFAETIREALGEEPELPERFAGLLDAPRHVDELTNSPEALKDYIRGHRNPIS
ncbi:threonine synthase [Aestuariimicrobium sp. T2.26MG-19.2B]|uniref:threonine synthase n=1 Tax=Aestuariimicrobium sp. T2.26MG-19.2B TaxID=3040679 RepID=UPI0024778D4A|nr:threonine synthase [Aestuariimicrobium sp. T2.26MG-19.2B]CAI9402865.1 Threonine synthase [Aestuariimicrobium sp. T2.26MG-19.2B]